MQMFCSCCCRILSWPSESVRATSMDFNLFHFVKFLLFKICKTLDYGLKALYLFSHWHLFYIVSQQNFTLKPWTLIKRPCLGIATRILSIQHIASPLTLVNAERNHSFWTTYLPKEMIFTQAGSMDIMKTRASIHMEIPTSFDAKIFEFAL